MVHSKVHLNLQNHLWRNPPPPPEHHSAPSQRNLKHAEHFLKPSHQTGHKKTMFFWPLSCPILVIDVTTRNETTTSDKHQSHTIWNISVTPTADAFPRALQYKWEAYCDTDARNIATHIGGVSQYKWEES